MDDKILDKVDLSIKAHFKLNELSLKKDLQWKAVLEITHILPRIYHDYKIRLVFDEEPFQSKIKGLEREIKEVQEEQQLFPEKQKEDIERVNKLINDTLADRDEKKSHCPELEFVADVETLSYKGGSSVLKLRVPDTIINDLNLQKHWFSYYRIELRPLE